MRPALLALLLIPGVLGVQITEVHPNPEVGDEYVEVWLDNASGTLTIADNHAVDTVELPEAYTGTVVIVDSASDVPALECPVLELQSRIGNGLSNSGDAITVSLGNDTDSFTYASSEAGVSLSRCLECEAFASEEPSPCVVHETRAEPEPAENPEDASEVCEPPRINADGIQEDRISYRITSSEAYEYWIEDAFGTTVRERSSSSTSSVKRYTPDVSERDHVFLIRAKSTCGEDEHVVGFISETEPRCELTDDQIIEAITEQIATYICRPHIEQAAVLEMQLDACENPEERMTSFYTRARTASESYTYRSSARSNASFIACAARSAQLDDDAITMEFSDNELANATPVLLAIENDTVVDVRLGDVPGFAGKAETPDSFDDAQAEHESDEAGVSKQDGRPEPLAREPLKRGIRAVWNAIRTSGAGRSVGTWIVPISFGIGGLVLALPRT